MRKFVTALILVPLAIVLVSFAVANRQIVTVSFDPFDRVNPAFSLAMPLFALILALLIGGVVIGGVAAWLRQGKWRWRARHYEDQLRTLSAEVEALKRHTGINETPAAPPVSSTPRLTIPPPAG